MSDSEGETFEKQVKIVIVGDGSSGKTSMSQRFSNDKFTPAYDQTLGIDYYLKRINLTRTYNVTLAINDIGGQTLGGAMLDKYIYGADIVLLVYDITNLQSFENLEDWYHSVMKYCAGRKPLFAVVGNKSDLEHLRAVKPEKHHQFAKDRDMLSYFVSAKTGESVENVFRQVTAHLMHVVLPKNDQDGARIIKAPIVRQESQNTTPIQPTSPLGSQSRTSVCNLQ
ncbi:unnamed protein product [Adineta steineri]|uniref:Uncharacterized protein n=1 Tax=Adineta steineri TaxID=433720 RepID=A0A814M977_9BILA|nr:unnamed protein product [Adineta steineri]CAF1034120.1 unnamed protein product [Adineta steineri]CAF1076406.1 unnamed protein product [Adineta steineri]CAF1237651.1 unnamed protein product [Adineta steineri]CAF3847780.1 unnamed protein product [Adineta steineri]